MAQAVLHPTVLDFIEVATRKEYPELQMEEQLVRPGSALDGNTVGASGLRSRLGLILVAIKRRDGHLAFNPGDDASVVAGDTLITLGPPEQLAHADAMALSR
jgi:voltage-gated potassium channel